MRNLKVKTISINTQVHIFYNFTCIDFEDNDEDEGDDEIEFKKFEEKDETALQKEDSKEDQNEELDVFDICNERKITEEELKTPQNEEEDKQIEESKTLNPTQISPRKVSTPSKLSNPFRNHQRLHYQK